MIAHNRETQLLQRAFRNLMNACARPGLLGDIEPLARTGEDAALPACFDMVVRTLVDQAVTFTVLGSRATEANTWISLQTHSHTAEVTQSDFVLVPDVANSSACREGVLKACAGTLIEPETSATIIIACGSLAGERIPGDDLTTVAPGNKTYCVRVEGPGVNGTATFFVDRIDWIEARSERGDEYPCGIDVILVDEQGHIVAVPRTTKVMAIEKEGAAWDM